MSDAAPEVQEPVVRLIVAAERSAAATERTAEAVRELGKRIESLQAALASHCAKVEPALAEHRRSLERRAEAESDDALAGRKLKTGLKQALGSRPAIVAYTAASTALAGALVHYLGGSP